MLTDADHAKKLSAKWGINHEDITAIALNFCGLNADIDDASRLRFRVRFDSRPDEQMYMILSLRRRQSPFTVVDNEIRLHGRRIATVDLAESDDAVLGYWRKGGKVLTLNSNARSTCTGCEFCPNIQEDSSDPRLRKPLELESCLAVLAADTGRPDMAEVENVTVCTGCFLQERPALDHLSAVRAAMATQQCTGTLQFLSSVLVSEQGLAEAAQLGPFALTLTMECFTRRNLLLKNSKAQLSPSQMVNVLDVARNLGITTDFTYIVGLDPADTAATRLADFVPVCSAFPKFQVFQPHNTSNERFIADGAHDIEYYLWMRREIERLFGPTNLRPRPWENYRPLWYFTFADEQLSGPRI
ncbi:radical SAM protein [Nocardia niigatensis]